MSNSTVDWLLQVIPFCSASIILSFYYEGFAFDQALTIKNTGIEAVPLRDVGLKLEKLDFSERVIDVVLNGTEIPVGGTFTVCDARMISLTPAAVGFACDQSVPDLLMSGFTAVSLRLRGAIADRFGPCCKIILSNIPVCDTFAKNAAMTRDPSIIRGNLDGFSGDWDGRDADGNCEWTREQIHYPFG